MTEAGPAAAQQLIELATAEWTSRAVWAAAELGLADLMADGPRSLDELARSCRAHSGALERLLRAPERVAEDELLEAQARAEGQRA